MNPSSAFAQLVWIGLSLGIGASRVLAQSDGETAILSGIEGRVEFAAAGTTNWIVAKPNQPLHVGDRLRTDKNSRALLRSSRLGEVRVRESSLLTLAPPKQTGGKPVMELIKGFFYFFNREKAIEVDLHNRPTWLTRAYKHAQTDPPAQEAITTEALQGQSVDGSQGPSERKALQYLDGFLGLPFVSEDERRVIVS